MINTETQSHDLFLDFYEDNHITITDFNQEVYNEFSDKLYKSIGKGNNLFVIDINSYGGEVYTLMGMLSIIDSVKDKITICTHTNTKAMSCGALLLASGTKGYRFASKEATILIHEVSSFSMGKTSDMKNEIEHINKLNDTFIFKILSKYCDQSKKFFKDKLKRRNLDMYITSKKAKKWGLIDDIGVPFITLEHELKSQVNLIKK